MINITDVLYTIAHMQKNTKDINRFLKMISAIELELSNVWAIYTFGDLETPDKYIYIEDTHWKSVQPYPVLESDIQTKVLELYGQELLPEINKIECVCEDISFIIGTKHTIFLERK